MHPIENIIESSIERIKRMVDVNTVIGDAVRADDGTLLLPVSRVSIGFAVGGGEYGEGEAKRRSRRQNESEKEEDERYPFTGATTVAMSLKPLAFLSVEQGNVRVLPAAPESAVDKLADLVPQVLKSLDRFVSAMVDNMNRKCDNKMNKYRRCRVDVPLDDAANTEESYE